MRWRGITSIMVPDKSTIKNKTLVVSGPSLLLFQTLFSCLFRSFIVLATHFVQVKGCPENISLLTNVKQYHLQQQSVSEILFHPLVQSSLQLAFGHQTVLIKPWIHCCHYVLFPFLLSPPLFVSLFFLRVLFTSLSLLNQTSLPAAN